MVLVKVLKRKDASSVAVAVVVGLVLYSLVSTFTTRWAAQISSNNAQISSDWHSQYLYPVVWALLEIIALEVLGWIYVLVAMTAKQK